MKPRIGLLVVLILVAAGSGVQAGSEGTEPESPPGLATKQPEPNRDKCLDAIAQVFGEDQRTASADVPLPCQELANLIRARLHEESHADSHGNAALPVSTSEAAVAPATDTPGSQDSAGQSSAVASGEPVAETGGSIALVGTAGTGLQLLTALAVNPIGAAVDPKDFKTIAWGTRGIDLSFVVPVNIISEPNIKKGPQYVGGHVRANLRWLLGGWDSSLVHALETYDRSLVASQRFIESFTTVLENAAEPKVCVQLALGKSTEHVGCEKFTANDAADVRAGMRQRVEALHAAQRDAATWYVTVEARADHGDVDGDGAMDKDTLFAGYLSAGYRFGASETRYFGLRARAGVARFKSGAGSTPNATVYNGAAGVDLGSAISRGRVAVSLGVELQGNNACDKTAAAICFRNLRLGVELPAAHGKTVGIAITQPIDDIHKDPVIVVEGNWLSFLEGSQN